LLIAVTLFSQIPVAFGINLPADVHAGEADEKAGKKPEIEEGETQNHRFNAIVDTKTQDQQGEGNSHHQEKCRQSALHKNKPSGLNIACAIRREAARLPDGSFHFRIKTAEGDFD
jgi:hypothetical protein